MPSFAEIRAPRRAVARFLPARTLPAYRYVPGLQPHPLRDPAGHSYHTGSPPPPHPPWDPSQWQTLTDWLWGVDLFNTFYFWEAHEAWERPWAVAPRHEPPALLLQGLIQIAAALLKIHLGALDGAARLSQAGLDKISRAAQTAPVLLGLDLDNVITDFRRYFGPLDARVLPPLDASVPTLLPCGTGA